MSASRASGVSPRVGRPRDVGIDDAISDAALEVLVIGGIAGFSLGEVARHAGVPKSTVYRRWDTQQALLVHAIDRLGEREPPVPDTGSLRDDLIALVEQRFLEFSTQSHATIERLGAEAEDPEVGAAVGRLAAMRHEAGRDVLRRGAERGELRPGIDVDTALEVVAGAVWTQIFSGHFDAPDAAVRLVDRVLGGFAPDA